MAELVENLAGLDDAGIDDGIENVKAVSACLDKTIVAEKGKML